jgi:hypothetical protein
MSGTNPVGTWGQTTYNSGTAIAWGAQIDADFAVAQRAADAFAPHPASPAAMSVIIDAGFIGAVLPSGLQSVTEVAQQSVTIAAAPSSPNNRIDLIVIDAATGTASVIAGTAATSPSAPAITAGKRQIAQVSVPNGTSAIGSFNITDLRDVWGPSRGGTPFCVASGSADALTGTFTPATPTLNAAKFEGYIWRVRATAANTTTTPTFAPDGQGPWTIKKSDGIALAPGDIAGSGHELLLAFNWNGGSPFVELLNPAAQSGFITGDVKTTLRTTADAGWVMMNDGTIGDVSSGATTRANADTQALFTLLWTNVSNANCPVSGGRGASAAADFAAHKTIALPKTLGRALAAAGAGSGLTSRGLGDAVGEEAHVLTTGEMPDHTHSYAYTIPTGSDYPNVNGTNAGGTNVSGMTGSIGGGAAHNNMQPTSFLNFMIKL